MDIKRLTHKVLASHILTSSAVIKHTKHASHAQSKLSSSNMDLNWISIKKPHCIRIFPASHAQIWTE